MNIKDFSWLREPKNFKIENEQLEVTTYPNTDLWQKTYYNFVNDNAPVFQMKTKKKYFLFIVKTNFDSNNRFDQCGIVMYLNSENWIKGSIEFENDDFQYLGSVVTNNGYSDWATTEIDAAIKEMWYRFSRRENDFCIECSLDGVKFQQLRICHMFNVDEEVSFGVYACSPENSSFKAIFSNFKFTECKWLAHTGQQPD